MRRGEMGFIWRGAGQGGISRAKGDGVGSQVSGLSLPRTHGRGDRGNEGVSRAEGRYPSPTSSAGATASDDRSSCLSIFFSRAGARAGRGSEERGE
jgi:hypothetical protein